ncbi:MAG: hypothetical protein ACI9PP_001306, partial [Halobacteriales archaeon]
MCRTGCVWDEMRRTQKLTALVVSLAVMLSVAAPAVAAPPAADDDLSVSVTQPGDGVALVTVVDEDGLVDEGTVNVTIADENASYDGTGTYEIDDGIVHLPSPDETVNITIVATVNGTNATTNATLTADDEDETELEVELEQADDGSATVVVTAEGDLEVENGSVTVEPVDDNATYRGAGTYNISNGTVSLPT